VRLARGHHAVAGAHEAGDADLGVVDGFGDAVVRHHGAERPVARHAPRRGHGQLTAVAAEPGRLSVDRDGPDRQPVQVEVERGQVLGAHGRDGRDAGEPAGGRRVLDVEAVVPDVVAAVAVQGQIGVAGPGCAGLELPAGRGRRRRRKRRQENSTEYERGQSRSQ
jgi:hypothetical protein